MLFTRKDQVCDSSGNAYPYCSPTSDEIWNNGTTHHFTWNYLFPFYSASETLDLFLYYNENLQYQPVKNWTSIPCNAGSWTVQVDDSWFPNQLHNQTQKKWIIYGFYLPSSIDPKEELSNPESQYPRPFNFSVMQFASDNNYTNALDNNHPSSSLPPLSNTPSPLLKDVDHLFPIWAIIVVTISSVTLFLLLIMFVLWLVYKRSSSRSSMAPTTIAAIPTQKEAEADISPAMPAGDSTENASTNEIIPANSTSATSDASWQRRSSILSSSHAALLGDTFRQILHTPEWDDQEERRRQLGNRLLQEELDADKGTMVRSAIESRRPQIENVHFEERRHSDNIHRSRSSSGSNNEVEVHRSSHS